MNEPQRNDPALSRFRLSGVILLLVAAGGVGALWAGKRRGLGQEAQALRAEAAAGTRVRVARAEQESGTGFLTFQGEAQPFVSTTIYPKVSGFLRQIPVDKGSVVRQGQLLAVLQSSETDRDAAALKADFDNKRHAADRNQELARQGIISAQAMEDAEAAAKVAMARLASQSVVQGYQRITAPFSGVVTQRYADPGALLQNGGSTSTSQPVLALAQVDRLRVVLYLDQAVAARVKVGTPVEVRPSDRPDQLRRLVISRVAGGLDPRTRTLLAEADLDNRDGAFLSGGAVVASLQVPPRPGALRVPSEAVVLRDRKPYVAVLTADQKVQFRQVLLGDDTGTVVQVLQGLQLSERVILSPPITLKDEERVQPVEASAANQAGKT